MNVELHIEELVLHGFPSVDGHAIARAVEAELARLLTERGLPAALASGADVRSLQGGSFDVRPPARPEVVGQQVAQSIYEGMDHEGMDR